MKNNNIEIPPFYVGQEVVANCDHPTGVFKKGDEFKVRDYYKQCCHWAISIGIIARSSHSRCTCGRLILHKTGEWDFAAFRFSPKLEIKDFISLKQLAEQQLELISAN